MIPTGLPPLVDAMSASDLITHQRKLGAAMGKDGKCTLVFDEYGVVTLLYPGAHLIGPKHDWSSAILAAWAWIDTHPSGPATRRAELKKAIARAMAELTELGPC